jgi:hypothetical protein
MTEAATVRHPASFRDPSGFVFHRDGVLYRQVNRVYAPHWERFISSRLYERAEASGDLIQHEMVDVEPADAALAHVVIRPERIPFVSYPYEWCFGQLQAAALLTLRLARLGLEHDMVLKDASAYNVQFAGRRPVWIDSLSFAIYREGEAWPAYRQFCQHFLAPLALAAKRDERLLRLLRTHIDGVPLDLASTLLPWRTRFSLPLLAHVHLHARAQRRYAAAAAPVRARPLSRHRLRALLDHLEACVRGLRWRPAGTEWAEYAADASYADAALAAKRDGVEAFLREAAPRLVWDLGANRGDMSRLASVRGITTIALDADTAAVEKNYRDSLRAQDAHLLPLVQDLGNPSPASGWNHAERDSLLARGPADAVLALALVHHLCISNHVPFPELAAFLARAGNWLAIEFVPKSDTQVQRLLRNRDDVFAHYAQDAFEQAFAARFEILRRMPLPGSERVLYWMRAR